MAEPGDSVRRWQARIEQVIAAALEPDGESPARLHEAMAYSMLGGGKRFRPVLVYATGEALGVETAALDPVACAIETIHGYSLIHDDLPAMDDDDLRRGNPTCHRAYDEATAILAGDALQALAFEYLGRHLPSGNPNSLAVIADIAAACGSRGMAGGQDLDLASVGRQVSSDDLYRMHRLKTGALIRVCVTAPARLAEISATTRAALVTYGEAVGLAFQIHDDILDVVGTESQTGKNSQSDAARDKPNFPSIIGLDESKREAERWCQEALKALESCEFDTHQLAWLATYVIGRNH